MSKNYNYRYLEKDFLDKEYTPGLTVLWCQNFDPSANFPVGGLSSKSCVLSMHTRDNVRDQKIQKKVSPSYPPKDAKELSITDKMSALEI